MYLVKIDDTIFPLGPSSFGETLNNGDEKVTLLNEGEIVIPKKEKLRSIQLELVIPGREYPFAYYPEDAFEAPETYIKKLKSLKEDKEPFLLILTRMQAGESVRSDFKMQVVMDDVSFAEDPDSGIDVNVSASFSQWRSYGTKKVTFTKTSSGTKKKTTTKRATTKKSTSTAAYTVKKGDTLIGIAKRKLGKSSRWTEIYKLNKSVIEKTAKKYGRKSSSNGHWIYPGTKLKIPKK